MSNTPLCDNLFPPSYVEDHFGYSQEWKNEVEKWLFVSKNINEVVYNKQKNRVKKAKQRDELIGEYKAMYVAKEMWHMQNVQFTNEENAIKKIVDFTFKDTEDNLWKVEVKSPSWLAELADDFENGIITKEQFLERKQKPQYINGESRCLGFDIFRNPIEDAIKKFQAEENNLLFLCPNTFAPLDFFGSLENWHQLRNIIAELDTEKKISTVCYFDVSLSGGVFNYKYPLIKIKSTPFIKE